MPFEQITYEVKGTTAIVTLNRPEKRNALNGQLLRELNAALKEADKYNAVHCVVPRGASPYRKRLFVPAVMESAPRRLLCSGPFRCQTDPCMNNGLAPEAFALSCSNCSA